jgi:hypothetical protein
LDFEGEHNDSWNTVPYFKGAYESMGVSRENKEAKDVRRYGRG